jgi:anti-sigma B factor antagonist
MSVSVTTREKSGVIILGVAGRVTLGEGATLLRDRIRQLSNSGQKKILLDLSDLTYLDSSGIGALVSSFATVRNQGGHLKLVKLSKRIQDLLILTKLYTVFEVFEDEQTAIGSFAEAEAASVHN